MLLLVLCFCSLRADPSRFIRLSLFTLMDLCLVVSHTHSHCYVLLLCYLSRALVPDILPLSVVS